MSNTLSLRFRHTQGDVGPLKFGSDTSVQGVKERLVTEWPTSGPLSSDKPVTAADVRLILSGKFLENNEKLEALKPSMGELKADTVITFHVIIKSMPLGKISGKLPTKEKDSGCSCCIQ